MSQTGASSDGGRISLVAGSVRMAVTDRTYISVEGLRPKTMGKPTLVDGRQVTVPAVSNNPKDQGRAVFYEVDRTGTVSDVVRLSRTRDHHGRLVPLQWLVSKSGVELVWPVDDDLIGQSFDRSVGDGELAKVFSTRAEACTHLRRSRPESLGFAPPTGCARLGRIPPKL